MAILLSDKVNFRAKKISRDQEGHYIIVKWSIHQEDVAILKQQSCQTCKAKTD